MQKTVKKKHRLVGKAYRKGKKIMRLKKAARAKMKR